jgi:hypothetical protein
MSYPDLYGGKMNWPAVRLWLYGVAFAAIPLGIYLGWFSEETAALLLPLLLAILNVPRNGAGGISSLRLRDLDSD